MERSDGAHALPGGQGQAGWERALPPLPQRSSRRRKKQLRQNLARLPLRASLLKGTGLGGRVEAGGRKRAGMEPLETWARGLRDPHPTVGTAGVRASLGTAPWEGRGGGRERRRCCGARAPGRCRRHAVGANGSVKESLLRSGRSRGRWSALSSSGQRELGEDSWTLHFRNVTPVLAHRPWRPGSGRGTNTPVGPLTRCPPWPGVCGAQDTPHHGLGGGG